MHTVRLASERTNARETERRDPSGTRIERAVRAVLESTVGRVKGEIEEQGQEESPEIPRMESRGTGQTGLVGCTEGSCQPAYRRRALYRTVVEKRRTDRSGRDR